MPPQHLSSSVPFLTEAGLETTIYYKHKINLPCFSGTPLLTSSSGQQLITSLYKAYANIAAAHGMGIILDTRTWRASSAWAEPLKFTEAELLDLNRSAVRLLKEVRRDLEKENPNIRIVLDGVLGPLRDAYETYSSDEISVVAAKDMYRDQISALVDEGVELLSLMTVTNLNEAIAIVELAKEKSIPVAVSFSLESDGKLLGGRSLENAIQSVDTATNGYTAYFGINCVHPVRILQPLQNMPSHLRQRIGLFRGNASLKSHEELDNSDTLDRGDIPTFVDAMKQVLELLPAVKAVGGCCGTDEEHLNAIAGLFT
ncbi:putative homocysteine S-methyltransferase [Talaromyces proteolyticus]|uniref:Homocysteine S-methyltransferase n=1 Tax=Talaromyces proteolyticus TaxID=1131652 RepID=A0AAD4KSS0_9EURO|nr:putative homocysteine S-methyltransferase [Talaromyces proteolyticus]KAH8697918.1 putative homocysteine S-methyltransferase [Talaromyces proteolyticus]